METAAAAASHHSCASGCPATHHSIETLLPGTQIAELKGQLAAAHAEIDASAAKVADAASVHSQIDWLHHRLQSSMEEIQVSAIATVLHAKYS